MICAKNSEGPLSCHTGAESLSRVALARRRLDAIRCLNRIHREEDASRAFQPGVELDQEETQGEGPHTAERDAAADSVERLEDLAYASSMRDMSAQGAMATLVGNRGRYLIRSACVTLGRGCSPDWDPAEAHADLSQELPPLSLAKMSRRQALLELGPGGTWEITNTGRLPVRVNGQELAAGCAYEVPDLSLVEIGTAALLFMSNPAAAERCTGGSGALPSQ
uniref:Microspherule protein 1 n=1 Tax=Tetraselmis sp. GSL018 TaxID=582737 RepID=A0A061RC96_9CHLO|mmetsp:Transcript_21857/g.52215  ORF Transcript_21857/g.52215 Transcript_21857/m.52215 type:complete len:222 (-) Transcript_21857:229-894(-)